VGRIFYGDWRCHLLALAVQRLHVGCVLVSAANTRPRCRRGLQWLSPGAPHISRVRDNTSRATSDAEQNAITDAARAA